MRVLDDRPAVRQFKARVYTGITRRFDSVTLRIYVRVRYRNILNGQY